MNIKHSRIWMAGIGLLVLAGLSGCYTKNIEDAFGEKVSSVESNKTINSYCQSCHIHREFVPDSHVEKVKLEYRRKVFRRATECRTCHYLEKKWSINDFIRKTRRPKEANLGKFKEFERKILKSQRDK